MGEHENQQHWIHETSDLQVSYSGYENRRCLCCGRHVYKTKRRPKKNPKGVKNLCKGYGIHLDYAIDIYECHGIIVHPRQLLCGVCKDKSLEDLQFNNIQTKNIKNNKHIHKILECQRKKEQKTNTSSTKKEKQRLCLNNLSDKEVRVSCGLHKAQLKRVVDELSSDNIHLNITHLFVACSVWYQDISYSYASILFNYNDKCYVSQIISGVVIILFNHWAPKYLGSEYWTKDKILNAHIPEFVNILYPNDNIIGAVDATYLYSQKSQKNYQYQKATYSNYKHLNLQKEHVFCTLDGFVISVDGPYFADGHNNDDIMWDSIINDENHAIHDIFDTHPILNDANEDVDIPQQKYCIVADRGYKKCVSHPSYKLIWPHAKSKRINKKKSNDDDQTDADIEPTQKQLTTEQSNTTRYLLFCCILCIWLFP